MVEVAGKESAVHWYGTFVQILLPGVVAGALLGWAWHAGGRRLVMAPLVFPLAVIVSPDTVRSILDGRVFFSDGLGGGALALPLFAMAGRVTWWRIVCGVFAVVPVPAWAIASGLISPQEPGLRTGQR